MSPLSVRLAPARFLDPVLVLLVLLGAALYLAFRGAGPASSRAQRVGRAGAWAAFAALWALSMPFVGNALTRLVELRGPDLAGALSGAPPERTALVVLSAGLRSMDTSFPPRERIDGASMARAIGAARLFQENRFGVVIVTGAPPDVTDGMAALMRSLGVPEDRMVLEQASRNTRENAAFSARILRERGVERVVVTTSGLHLRRAEREFARAGMTVIPAAVDVVGEAPWGIDGLLPSSGGLLRTDRVVHEILGYVKP